MLNLRVFPSLDELKQLKALSPSVDLEAVYLQLRMVQTVARSINVLDAHLKRDGLSLPRFVLLGVLYRNGKAGLTPSDLAQMMDVTRATMTGLLGGLEGEGLIERVPIPEDRRSVRIQLTAAGVSVLRRILPRHTQRIATVMDRLSARRRKELHNTLSLLTEGFDELDAGRKEK